MDSVTEVLVRVVCCVLLFAATTPTPVDAQLEITTEPPMPDTSTSATSPPTTTLPALPSSLPTSATATTSASATLTTSVDPAAAAAATTTAAAGSNTTVAATILPNLPTVGVDGGGGGLGGVVNIPEPWMTTWQYHCLRPTSPCDGMYGMCMDTTGHCNCFNQAFGVQCQASGGSLRNGGVCLLSNPCKQGECYDEGIGAAKCACPDGYYGDTCEHKMVYAECSAQKMVVNIFPYGFSEVRWDSIPAPVTTNGCQLDRMAPFLASRPSYQNRGWQGFAREFLHLGDPCGGDVNIENTTTADVTVYSREVYVQYATGRHYTDTKVKVVCEVKNNQGSSSSSGSLPPPRVNVQVLDAVYGRLLYGPIKLGSTAVVKFSVNSVNNANIDDIRVEMCTVASAMGSSQKIIVLDGGCVVPPVGKMIQSGQGTEFLTLVVHTFPNSPFLDFQCRVRLCDSLRHNECSTARHCYGRRRRRETNADTDVSHSAHTVHVDFQLVK